jgi:chromosome segregation ATPase
MALVISGRNRDFINAFDESLRRLNEINAAIAKNTENKRKFSGDVLLKLQALHERIKEIVGKIARIKQKIVELQGLVIQNNSGVQAKEDELNNLKQQLAALTTERDNLTTQLDQVRNDSVAREAALQQQINDSEAQLRALTNTNAELTNSKNTIESELNALRADVANRGDAQSQQHAQQLQELTQQHREAIEQLNNQIADNQRQIAENERRIQELTTQDGEKTRQMQDLVNRNTELENRNRDLEAQANAVQQQLSTTQTELQTLQQNFTNLEADSTARIEQALQDYRRLEEQIAENNRQITALQATIESKDQEILRLQNDANNVVNAIRDKDSEISNLNNQIAEITRQRDELQAFSDELERKIKEATIAITNASNNLAELTNQGFYDDSNNRVQSVITEIEEMLKIINGDIDGSLNQRGQPPAGGISLQPPAGGLPNPISPSPGNQGSLNIKQISIRGYNLENLKTALRTRGSREQDKLGNKYNQAIIEIGDYILNLDRKNETNNSVKTRIETILRNKGINFNSNGTLMGGYNKTNKKNTKHKKRVNLTRKQRGGFLYGKYKNTSSKSKNTTKTTSSYNNTSKKYKKLKVKHLSKRKIF